MKITVLTITCPETQKTTAVDVAASEAAFGTFFNEPTLRLSQCSRWPNGRIAARNACDRLRRTRNCLLWNIIAKWYESKKCAFCRKPIDPLSHVDRAPALLAPDFRTAE